jgi:hypothetical protein
MTSDDVTPDAAPAPSAAEAGAPEQRRASIPFIIAALVLAVVPLALLALPFAGAGFVAAALIAAGVVLGAIGVARATGAARARALAVVALALAVTTGTVSSAIGAGATLAAGVETLRSAAGDAPSELVDLFTGGAATGGDAVAEPAQISGQWVVDELLRLCDASALHAVPSANEPTLFLVGERPVSADAFDFTVTVTAGDDAWSGELRGDAPPGVQVLSADEVNPLGCADVEIDPATGEVIGEGGGADAPVAEGEVPFSEIEVGMCVNDADITESVWGLPVVDCAEPHDSEVYAIFELPAGEYPGDDEVIRLSDEGCFAAFADYVGVPYDQSVLYFQFYWPDKRGWAVDDRAVICTLYDQEGPLVGSVRGSGR